MQRRSYWRAGDAKSARARDPSIIFERKIALDAIGDDLVQQVAKDFVILPGRQVSIVASPRCTRVAGRVEDANGLIYFGALNPVISDKE